MDPFNSPSIRTVVSWAWPFLLAPLCWRVTLCSHTSCVKAVHSESFWTPVLHPGTPALQVSHPLQLFLLSRGYNRHFLLQPEQSVRWETCNSILMIWFWTPLTPKVINSIYFYHKHKTLSVCFFSEGVVNGWFSWFWENSLGKDSH